MRGGGNSDYRLLEPFSPCEEKTCYYARQRSNPKTDSGLLRRASALFAIAKKDGFTLAEVLITIAILGLLAAIVIPNMFKAYQQYQMVSKLKVAYALLNDVVAQSEIENGPIANWDLTYNDSGNINIFNKYFRPYLKISKDCGPGQNTVGDDNKNNWCFYGPNGGWTDLANNEYDARGYYKVILKNGMSLATFYGRSRSYYIVVDIDGRKGKGQLGKDVFFFTIPIQAHKQQLYTGYIGPYFKEENPKDGKGYANYNYFNLLPRVMKNCTKNRSDYTSLGWADQYENRQGSLCARAIELNGWKVPEGYPW